MRRYLIYEEINTNPDKYMEPAPMKEIIYPWEEPTKTYNLFNTFQYGCKKLAITVLKHDGQWKTVYSSLENGVQNITANNVSSLFEPPRKIVVLSALLEVVKEIQMKSENYHIDIPSSL